MDLNLRGEASSFLEEEEEEIRGKHQYYPFSSSSSSSGSTSYSSPLQYNRGFIALSDHRHPPMGSWLGDHGFKPQEDNTVQPGDGSMNNLEFTDLSMNLECREEDDEEDGGDDKKRSREAVVEKVHMFDKVVTPSDVGKLNRLVIPKQHAERFFPLHSSTSEKGGLLLSFEDRTGKPWWFRYSYWNSSQSYVMTKGWSRFVKEKKLDAGDIVSFQRGVGDNDRLFIDSRHKPNTLPDIPMSITYPGTVSFPHSFSFHRPAPTGIWNVNYHSNYPRDHHYMGSRGTNDVGLNPSRTNIYGNSIHSTYGDPVIYLRSSAAAPAGRGGSIYGGGIERPVVFKSVPVVQGTKAVLAPTKKQLRLFGVNMDCPMSESEDSESPMLSDSQSSQYPQLNVYNGMPVPSGWSDKGKGLTSSLEMGTSESDAFRHGERTFTKKHHDLPSYGHEARD